MRTISVNTLLLILLLVLCGQASAAPCAEMDGHKPASASAGPMHGADHGMHGIEATGHGDTFVSNAAPIDSPTDCGPACNCCPGHCASVLPAAEIQQLFFARSFPLSDYRQADTSPQPESAFRPPIPA